MTAALQQSITWPQPKCDLQDINGFAVVQKGVVDAQLIAYNKEMYDILPEAQPTWPLHGSKACYT